MLLRNYKALHFQDLGKLSSVISRCPKVLMLLKHTVSIIVRLKSFCGHR